MFMAKMNLSVFALLILMASCSAYSMEKDEDPSQKRTREETSEKKDGSSNKKAKSGSTTDFKKKSLLREVRNFYAGLGFSKTTKELFESAALGDKEGVLRALAKFKNIRDIKADRFGFTPLHHAVAQGHASIVEELLNRGMDVNNGDNTPLRLAAEHNHLNVVRLLITRGASLSLVNDNSSRRILFVLLRMGICLW